MAQKLNLFDTATDTGSAILRGSEWLFACSIAGDHTDKVPRLQIWTDREKPNTQREKLAEASYDEPEIVTETVNGRAITCTLFVMRLSATETEDIPPTEPNLARARLGRDLWAWEFQLTVPGDESQTKTYYIGEIAVLSGVTVPAGVNP